MPNDLISNDPIVAQNFFMEIDGANIILSGVSGLDMEIDVVTIQQNGKDGKMQTVKTRGTATKAADLSITRMAPSDAMNDPIWKWFTGIRDGGLTSSRSSSRKNGSIVLYDTSFKELGRFSFFNGWPSKIATDAVSTDSNDAVKETITLVIERLERVK